MTNNSKTSQKLSTFSPTQYLKPDFEIESGARVAGGMEQTEGNAAVNTATDENSHPEALAGHRALEVGFEVERGGGNRRGRRRMG